MPGTRNRDPELTKSAILDAAEEIFIDKGPSNTSLSMIARKAQVTKSLIHHHFESKEHLWNEVKKRAHREYMEKQGAILHFSDANLKTLAESLKTYFRFIQANPGFIRLLSWMNLEDGADKGDFFTEETQLITLATERIAESQSAGHMRNDIPAAHVVISFLAVCHTWFQEKNSFARYFSRESDSAIESETLDEQFLQSAIKIITDGVKNRD
jgi:TetR/AcrR family transcriptional regulator